MAQYARAERLLELGDRAGAIAILTRPENAAPADAASRTRAAAAWLLGRAYLQSGQLEAAQPPLQSAVDLAEATPLPELRAATLNDLGLLHAANDDLDQADAAFARGLQAAAQQPELAARIRINQADLRRRLHDDAEAETLLWAALADAGAVSSTASAVRLETAAASRLIALHQVDAEAQLLGRVEPLLQRAQLGAAALGDARAESEAWGELGRLHALQGRSGTALEDTRQALFAAQQAQAPELLYRWEWQAGRLLAQGGQVEQALPFYARAAATLQPIRLDLLQELRGRGESYRDAVGPLYLEYADLLLRAADSLPDQTQNRLAAAREAVEQMKTVELEDYFHDQCVAQFRARRGDIAALDTHTAVLYPIILPDRVELLLGIGDRLRRFTVAVPGKTLSDEALRLRKLLVRSSTDQYLESAQHLHRWLIEPLRGELEASGVDTLVVVPDGALLGVPFAALHDGKSFLIERYAVATAPALHLIEPAAVHAADARALAGGLSDAVQGFTALPGVDHELSEVGQVYDAQLLANREFTVSNFENAVDRRTFDVVHIASHGVFAHDVGGSFLLTYDGRMGMDALERIVKAGRFRSQPVDLLTLSACETAAGDERAELGLAGVAIKAGARSVVATLWLVSDEASTELIGELYRQLAAGGGKAKALQAAQRRLLANPRFRHPSYWAPYLLIGSWS